ncbi:MAG: GntR family transcriptional regulator, partial [Hyphomicrobiales bacterium]
MNLQQPLQIIPRPSLHAELVERIRGLIVDSTLPAGSKIPEKDLCAKFGVSRTPMREALKVLAVDGLVSLEPNRGAWVSKLTIQELEEVFPVMGALEALSGEQACKHITSEEFAVIEDLHNQMVLHFQNKDLDRYFHTNQQIHEVILAAAKNATLSAQYRSLATRVRQARYLA